MTFSSDARVNRFHQITERIIDRSRATRTAFLKRVEAAAAQGRSARGLSCGNLAHGVAACGKEEKRRLLGDAPNLAIVTAYNDMLSAHQPYRDYPQQIKAVALAQGATAQVAGGVPAMCDGVTQGQPGMELSLFSRDLIAMATAVSLSHNLFDGVLCLGVCDKIVPGLLIGALSFAHLPTVFLPAGPMPSGITNEAKSKVRQDYAAGKVGRDELLAAECAAYHSPGTCTFYGTANSNQMLMEIMGLHLPGSSFVQPGTSLRKHLTDKAVEVLLAQLRAKPVQLADIISEKTIVNGMVGLLASGGSTNHAMHLVAIARAAGILIDWQDLSDLSAIVPLLCRIYPNGEADINHFQQAGGMAFFMRELAESGLLHQDVKTVLGDGLSAYFKKPELSVRRDAEIFKERSEAVEHRVEWRETVKQSADESVLRPAKRPFSNEGGLKLLCGNLGRAVIKVSAVAPEQQTIKAPALVFESQQAFEQSFKDGELERDFIAVIRYQGPKANGMPELHKLTPILSLLQARGYRVALLTDGRMSGASGKVAAAIHVTPEASAGGNIGKVENGDLIELDAKTGRLQLLVDEQTLQQRSNSNFDFKAQPYGMGRELFNAFRNNISSAEEGASVLF